MEVKSFVGQIQVEPASELIASALGQELSENLIEKVRRHLEKIDYCVVAKSGEEIVGLGLYVRISLPEGNILYEDTKMVRLEYQGRGIGTKISKRAEFEMGSDCVLAMMRTQNAAEVISFEKAFGSTVPFQSQEQSHLEALKAVSEFFNLSEGLDFERGTFHYSRIEANMGNFEIKICDPRVAIIEELFEKREIQREYGGMLYFIASLKGKD